MVVGTALVVRHADQAREQPHAVGPGIRNGYSDGTFRPSTSATRGQIAKIGYRAVTNPAGACSP